MFLNSFDRVENVTKRERKKGTSIGTNTKRIEPRNNSRCRDQKSSIFPTGPVVAGWYIIGGIIKSSL